MLKTNNYTMQCHYILVGKKPEPIHDLLEWAEWMGKANRTVKETLLPDNLRVSTVFLGLDHQFGYILGKGAGLGTFSLTPILFETMIFGGEYDGYCERYATWEEAEQGHEAAINLIFEV